MKRIVAGLIVAVDRDALETIDGPSFRNEDRDQTETDDPEESGIHLWPSVERFSPDVRSPGCRQLLNARGLESSSSRIVMSDRRKKPMSRDQRLPRRESNLTEKSIYREKNPPERYRWCSSTTQCVHDQLSTAKCVLSVVTKAMISNVVDPHLYSAFIPRRSMIFRDGLEKTAVSRSQFFLPRAAFLPESTQLM